MGYSGSFLNEFKEKISEQLQKIDAVRALLSRFFRSAASRASPANFVASSLFTSAADRVIFISFPCVAWQDNEITQRRRLS
uniref:hypothetical protein n=1 Tax=Candidatus Electronema sp. TaxID=2698783 RepID=UPI0040563D6C